MTELLTDRDIESAELTEWTVVDKSLTRTVELASFPAAIEAVNRVAEAAEQADHHPDIDIRWRTLTFTLTTHSAGVEPAGTTQKTGVEPAGTTQKTGVDLAGTTQKTGVEPAGTTQKKVSGLTQKDVDLARRIDELIAN